jgi:hypothetical protein
MKKLNQLDKVLDEAKKLSLEQQEMLIEILKNRLSENQREQIAQDAKVSLAEFHAGKLKIQTAADAIKELQGFINNPDREDD